VRERLVPAENEVAETDEIPESIVQEMRDMGLFGLTIPEEFGGLELTMEEECPCAAGAGPTAPAFRSVIGTTVGIGSQGILMDGTPEQKAEWLPKLATGEVIASFALTEPEAGSDAASLRTTAIKDGDHYVVNGTKRYITNAPHAGMFTLMARTNPADKGAGGVSRLHRRRQDARHQLRQVRQEDGPAGAHTCDVIFDNVPRAGRQPDRRPEGQGFKTAMKVLEKGRIHIAAVAWAWPSACCATRCAMRWSASSSASRSADFQLVQAMLADSQAELYAAECMVLDAARRRDDGQNVSTEASCARCSPPRCAAAWPTARCRSSAAPAMWPSTASSASTATCACSASTRARRRSSRCRRPS
jgi:acyl-CoA dehydrogenase